MLPARRTAHSLPRRIATSTALLTALATIPVLGATAVPADARTAPGSAVTAPSIDTEVGEHDLSVDFDEAASSVRSGVSFEVSGTVRRASDVLAAARQSLPTAPVAGVAASFTLALVAPDGTVLATQDVVTDDDGAFRTTVPGAATRDLDDSAALTLGLRAIRASDIDGRTTADAGAAPVLLASAGGLDLTNSFVSSVGWVKPGETYPSTITVSNPAATPVAGAVVDVSVPTGTTFESAKPSAGTRTISATEVVWTIPSVPAATADGPGVVSLVLENTAALASQEPTIVWRDLSTTATLTVGTETSDATAHGPKVIPPSETYETARYGDRPFPIVPVQYTDRTYVEGHTGETLAEKINSPDVAGSTFNLFQEMSLGQLYPNGTVPSAGLATADFDYEPGFDLTQTVPGQTCTGTTFSDLPFDVSGTALYPERVTDGVYNLPGQTQYYGADANGSAVIGSLAGIGALQNIDSGCGPTGKLVRDAAALADPEIDYSDFDTDKDGLVDFFMVVYAGCGGNGASQLGACSDADSDLLPYDNIWPHSSSLEGSYSDPVTGLSGYVTDDQLKDLEGNPLWFTDTTYSTKTTEDLGEALKVFVRVGPYNVNPETAIDKASVISHEYGHSLGLPDFYSLGGRETYGDWNLMATDKSQNMDAFSRQELGWVVPQVLVPGQTEVTGFQHSKVDTGSITWATPDGEPYTLTDGADGIVHNSEMYVAKLPGRTLLDTEAFESGDGATADHLWWSGSGNDFGCVPSGGRNLDIAIPGLADLDPGTPVTLSFKSRWNIEWDYDYGFVLTTTDGGSTYTSHESEEGYTTSATGIPVGNPNQVGCLSTYDNGLTGSSGSYAAGTADLDRLLGEQPDPVFLADSYDISDLAGAEQGALRFSYATDPGLALPGWFIDDVAVTATVDGTDKVLFETDFEESGEPGDERIFNGGCKEDLSTASRCTLGWKYLQAGAASPQDHAYYLEMRDRSGFDFDGKGEIDRDPIGFEAGLSLVYTDEAHGYGNAGTDDPPAQSPLDATPTAGSSSPDLDDAAFTAADGRSTFSDAADDPHVDNYADPSSPSGDWTFDYDCLDFTVTSMSGQDAAPEGNLTGDVLFDLGEGCSDFDYGYVDEEPLPTNLAPTAVASADPTSAQTGEAIAFSGLGSSDDTDAVADLDFSWDFGDGGSTKDATGATVSRSYLEAGEYDVTLTVTDTRGLQDTDSVTVTITGETVENTAPPAEAAAEPSTVGVGETVALSAAGSTDAETPDGLTYAWDFGDGGPTTDGTGREVTTTYSEAGEYTATVTVTDPEGLSDSASATVTVTAAETPVDTTDPTAVAKVSPRKVFVKRQVSLDASGSSDDVTDSDDLTYEWSRGDGGATVDATGRQATVKFRKPGRYSVRLTVTDEAGNSASTSKRVRVLRYVACRSRSVERQGSWKVRKDASVPRGSYCDTSGKGKRRSVITYSFTGQKLQILQGKASSGGFAKVIVDGKKRKQLNFRSKDGTDDIAFDKVRTYGKLGRGTHTVRVVMKKTRSSRNDGFLAGFVVRR
ncbi:MAG: hypothetical protein CMJ44_14890 [Pimelobacter sp.]|nr:hypothetical protein [Pimelobacter sp.]